MKIAVFGNRSITNQGTIAEYLNDQLEAVDSNYTLLHGGAEGPQKFAVDWFESVAIWDVVLFKPWHMVWNNIVFDRTLFFMRNKQIIDNADKIIIFSNGEKDSEVTRVKDYCDKHQIQYDFVEVN